MAPKVSLRAQLHRPRCGGGWYTMNMTKAKTKTKTKTRTKTKTKTKMAK